MVQESMENFTNITTDVILYDGAAYTLNYSDYNNFNKQIMSYVS